MKKLSVLLCLCLCAVSAAAQTQQGYVKTLGRPNQKGQALSGVTIRVKGGHNAVLSSVDGAFTLTLTGKKLGESYQLQQVQKQGYELKDKGAVGRQYAYSDKVPLVLVMQSRQHYQEEKQRIENSIYAAMERRYQSDIERLEQQKASNQLAIEQYRQQLQQLQQNFERIQGLVDGLAEHYALVDYDELNDKEREINLSIEAGQLEKADSLLQLLGVQKQAQDIAQRLQAGQKLQEEAQQDMAAILKQQEKDAEHLYQLYTIALSRYDNDKARFYIETRAALDTTNVEWQNDVACYIEKYWGDHQKSLSYFKRMLVLARQQSDECSGWMSIAYAGIAAIYRSMGNFQQALEYNNKSLSIAIETYGKEHYETASIYSNIGLLYSEMEDYNQAIEYQTKALLIIEKVLGPHHPNIYQPCANLGFVLHNQNPMGNFQLALAYYQRALGVLDDKVVSFYPEIASIYDNLGRLYEDQGDLTNALRCHIESLRYAEKVLNKQHPDLASNYNNIASVYEHQGNGDKAVEYYMKALEISKNAYGEYHGNVATVYGNLAAFYSNKELYSKEKNDYDLSVEYGRKALEILEHIKGAEHIDVAYYCVTLGELLDKQGNKEEALSYLVKGFSRIEKEKIDDYQFLALTSAEIAGLFYNQKDYANAIVYYKKELDYEEKRDCSPRHKATLLALIGICYRNIKNFSLSLDFLQQSLLTHQSASDEFRKEIANDYSQIGKTYQDQNNDEKALEYYLKALKIHKSLGGDSEERAGYDCLDVGFVYRKMGQYSEALDYYNKAYAIFVQLYGEYHRLVATSYNSVGLVYENMGDYPQALSNFQKALVVREKVLGPDHSVTKKNREKIEEIKEKMK